MPNALQQAMNELAGEFVASIIEVIRRSSLADVLQDSSVTAPPPPPPPAHSQRPLPAASPAPRAPPPRTAPARAPHAPPQRGPRHDTTKDAAVIVAYLRSHAGTTGEAARRALGLEKNRWNTCVYRAIRDGKVRKEGTKRTTLYWAV